MLSEYYDEIFPVNENAAGLIKTFAGDGGRVLDVGCATGALVRRLDSFGLDAYGLEYEPSLVRYTEKTVIGDMHSLDFPAEHFDCLSCTGNTLAHVRDMDGAVQVMKEFYKVLKTDGKALIQILNYDRIIKERPAGLPDIVTKNVTFQRKYRYMESSIEFTGVITSEKGSVSSSVLLYPLTSEELIESSVIAGFSECSLYGGFDLSPLIYDESFPLVAVLTK